MQMIKAIAKEAEMQNDYTNEDIATVYLGGGTPSLLDITELVLLMEKINRLVAVHVVNAAVHTHRRVNEQPGQLVPFLHIRLHKPFRLGGLLPAIDVIRDKLGGRGLKGTVGNGDHFRARGIEGADGYHREQAGL